MLERMIVKHWIALTVGFTLLSISLTVIAPCTSCSE